MSCCNSTPCCCPSTDPISGCADPGIIQEGIHPYTLDGEYCPKRLAPFRGLDEDGEPIVDTLEPILRAYRVTDEEGHDLLANPPCVEFPVYRLTIDGIGYGENGFDKIIGRSSSCEMDIKGSATDDGVLFWNHVSQQWQLREGTPLMEDCITNTAPVFILTTDVDSYQFFVLGATAEWSVGGSFVADLVKASDETPLNRSTFKILEMTPIGSNHLVIAKLTSGLPSELAVLPALVCVTYIGFVAPDFCNLDPVEETPDDNNAKVFDKLIVCDDGELRTLEPVNGETLVCEDGKWKLRADGLITFAEGRPELFTRTSQTTSEADVNMIRQPGYSSRFRGVILAFYTHLTTKDADAKLSLKCQGLIHCEARVRSADEASGEFNNSDSDRVEAHVKLPSDKSLNFQHFFEYLDATDDGGTAGTAMGLVISRVNLVGWF